MQLLLPNWMFGKLSNLQRLLTVELLETMSFKNWVVQESLKHRMRVRKIFKLPGNTQKVLFLALQVNVFGCGFISQKPHGTFMRNGKRGWG
jgi:hypothetical protein